MSAAEDDDDFAPVQGPARVIEKRWVVEVHQPIPPGLDGSIVLTVNKPGREENATGKPRGRPRRSGRFVVRDEQGAATALTDDALAVLALARVEQGVKVQTAAKDVVAEHSRACTGRSDLGTEAHIERVRKLVRAALGARSRSDG
ncbi:MAG: hypothetical protein OEL76_03965 [Siculibacillus sp.]|nr:hypothetical protein [Siculibacillus sp.]